MPGLTRIEAAEILGVHPDGMYQLAKRQGWLLSSERGRPFDLDVVEAHAMSLRRIRAGNDFWMNTRQAAVALGCPVDQVSRMIRRQQVPALRHRSGQWLLRRHQVLVIVNARRAQLLRG